MKKALVVLLIGKSARLDAMAAALWKSPRPKKLYIMSEVVNPSLKLHSTEVIEGDSSNRAEVVKYARSINADFVVIGPEEPLAAGVVDALAEVDIPSVGPTEALAKIESSKSFARDLIARHGIGGNPEHRTFHTSVGLKHYLVSLGEFVVKPDGLTGGKGVRVWGDHFSTIEDGYDYCHEILSSGGRVVVEEKLDGEEFSFQSFCDGKTVIDTPPVQDHKRQGEGDTGPNTGGMGSYSCENHLLPFLSQDDIDQASRINKAVAGALLKETGVPYKGILYGGFMVTKRGIRVIEYNARFGDPECMNILPLLENDFLDICEAIVMGTLDKIDVQFARKATVCKYVVPIGYPEAPVKGELVHVPDFADDNIRVYQGAVEGSTMGQLRLAGSRAIAVVGIGASLEEAERYAETAVSQISGPVFHRRDIGTAALVQARVDHMKKVRSARLSHADTNFRQDEVLVQTM